MTAPIPTALLQASLSDIVNELLRRGFSIEEMCHRTGLANPEELRRLIGVEQ
jgi:hypothetical protein